MTKKRFTSFLFALACSVSACTDDLQKGDGIVQQDTCRDFSEPLWGTPPFDSLIADMEDINYQMFDSAQKKFVRAEENIQKLLMGYSYWKDKGPVKDNRRFTIMTCKTKYQLNEPIIITHVMEELEAGRSLYVMGPKAICGEFVNDSAASMPCITNEPEPWLPMIYNGLTLDSPGMDYNFEITQYRFKTAGTYEIQWRPGECSSNVITVMVSE